MRVAVPALIEPPERLGRVHLVGIGGAALSGLARLFVARGLSVTGSDAKDSDVLRSLADIGVRCWVGHDAAHVDDADTVVVSAAVHTDNPEVLRAVQRGLRLWPRSAAVQSVMLGRTAVVVTGTHGKTTTTSMLVTALLAAGADPSYAIGSTLNVSGLNAADGGGPVFVAEGDESDAAILVYTPAGAVVTNVDVDHLDFFGTATAYAAVFEEFLTRVQAGGFLVCCVDDPGAARLAETGRSRGLDVVTVSAQADRADVADLVARDVICIGERSSFDVTSAEGLLGAVRLQVPGPVYVLDALAALGAGLRLGYPFADLAAGLAGFRGSGRRMQLRGEAGGVRVYDSYAHLPAEITADLGAARAVAGGGRVVVCYQPHLFSRTRIFGAEMGRALGAADEVVVMNVYPAREEPEPGVDGSLVADAVPGDPARVCFEPDWDKAAERVLARCRPGDLVLTLGAGDVTEVGPIVLAGLSGHDDQERRQ